MVRSMTGFGKSELSYPQGELKIEIKSINHKYCDVNIRCHKSFAFLENDLIKVIKSKLSRGKIDVFIQHDTRLSNQSHLTYEVDIAKAYYDTYQKISQDFNLPLGLDAYTLSGCEGVLNLEREVIDEDVLKNAVMACLESALESHIQSRILEGKELLDDLVNKLDYMSEIRDNIEIKMPLLVEAYKANLRENIEALLEDTLVDETRLLQEVAIYADKVAIDEELVRLKSHIQSMSQVFEKGGEMGRKLDFIAQEMNREANTILSKTTDISISQLGIELKTTIEKIREQVQNIE